MAHDVVEEVVPLGPVTFEVERPRHPEALLDEEAFEQDEFLPYWADLWPSALSLAKAVAPRALRGARVIELGCGLGLPSLAAAHAGGRVLATDWAPDALAYVERNAARNGLRVEVAVSDWRDPGPLLARGPFDLVLASDVLYEARNVGPLLDVLPRLAGEVLLADPGRATAEEFFRAAPQRGWLVEPVADRVSRLRRRSDARTSGSA